MELNNISEENKDHIRAGDGLIVYKNEVNLLYNKSTRELVNEDEKAAREAAIEYIKSTSKASERCHY